MPEIYTKKRQLLLVQTDHITGEKAATAIEALYRAGAKNVQVQSTVTKKNRPGLVFLIDTDEEARDAVEASILRDIGATGWHRIPTEHCFIPVEQATVTMAVRIGDSMIGSLAVTRKISSADPEVIRPEYDSLAEIQDMLRKAGEEVSLALIEQKVTEAFLSDDKEKTIVF